MVDLRQLVNFDYSYQNLPNTELKDRFSMVFKPIERPLLSWRDEVLKTAINIKKLADNRPLILCLSGGMDGEIAAYAFIECDIKFSVLTCRHVSATNEHDIRNAIRFCKKNNIEQTIFEINPYEFFINGIEKYIDQGYRSTRIFRYFQLLLLDTVKSMNGCAVLGGGDQMYYNSGGVSVLKYAPDFTLVADWCRNNNSINFPYFYKQNPHVFAAYMNESLINFLLQNSRYFREDWSPSLEKELIYNFNWPALPKRVKYTGFEYIHHFKTVIENNLDKRFPDIQELSIPVTIVEQQLGI